MAVSGTTKALKDIMRIDAGINGDAQYIEQITWMLFLKAFDFKEDEWNLPRMTTILLFLSSIAGRTGRKMPRARREMLCLHTLMRCSKVCAGWTFRMMPRNASG